MKDFFLFFGVVFLGCIYVLRYIDKRQKIITQVEPEKKGRTVLVFSLILFCMGVLAIAFSVKP